MKVVIGVPSGENVKADFAFSLAGVVYYTGDLTIVGETSAIELGMINFRSSILAHARQKIAEYALKQEADYILWIDSDHKFPEDILVRLLSHRKDIVGCAYSSRRAGQRIQNVIPWLDVFGTEELFNVQTLGFGTILTATRIFKEIPKPWFECRWIEDGGFFTGEDTTWCKKVREAGYSIWVDPVASRTVKHIGDFPFSLDLKADAQLAISQANEIKLRPGSEDLSGVWKCPQWD